MEMQGIKNIVFDFGCVLVDLDKQACVEALNRIGANNVSAYVDEGRQEDLFHELETGNISVGDFCNEVRMLCPDCHATDEQICEAWNALLTGIPQQRLERLISLKKDYRLLLLSNTNPIHWHKSVRDYFPHDGYEVDDYFEKTFLSYRMHLIKPDERIFREMLIAAEMMPHETLFIDDSPMNCAAASELGINTICVSHGDEWLDKI